MLAVIGALAFDLPAGAYWDALLTSDGQRYTFTNRSWNGTIAPGASVSFGFLGSGSGVPTNCLLNGAACAGGSTPPPTTPPPTTPSTTGLPKHIVPPSVVNAALDCLAGGTNCGGFRPPRTYPGLRGAMTWSINWAVTNGNSFARTVAPHLRTLPD